MASVRVCARVRGPNDGAHRMGDGLTGAAHPQAAGAVDMEHRQGKVASPEAETRVKEKE
jgi:hypothetical protein